MRAFILKENISSDTMSEKETLYTRETFRGKPENFTSTDTHDDIVQQAVTYALTHGSNNPLALCAETVIRLLRERGLMK